jgi:hypothetical protein
MIVRKKGKKPTFSKKVSHLALKNTCLLAILSDDLILGNTFLKNRYLFY